MIYANNLGFSKATNQAKLRALKVAMPERFDKVRKHIYTFDLLSGYACPFAKLCLSKVKETAEGTLKLVDGISTKFRCFSASQEAQYTNTYKHRKRNFDALRGKSREEMRSLLSEALPKNAAIVRIHVAGDFFNAAYLLAWVDVAQANPDVLFYAYTKSLVYWRDNKNIIDNTPNIVLTASYGGALDEMITSEGFRSAKVVFSEAEANTQHLPIDHDDSHAANPTTRQQSFALLIHGTQPKGSEAGQALRALKGKGSYSRA